MGLCSFCANEPGFAPWFQLPNVKTAFRSMTSCPAIKHASATCISMQPAGCYYCQHKPQSPTITQTLHCSAILSHSQLALSYGVGYSIEAHLIKGLLPRAGDEVPVGLLDAPPQLPVQ